jgi:hypothetical protein
MNAIAPRPANDDGAIVEPSAPGTLIEFLARAVRDPSIDVHKLEAIYRMQREIVADDRRVQFHDAMSAVQGEILPVARNAYNDQTKSKFATLEAVDVAIRPIYTAHGFRLSFTETPSDAPEMRITCLCSRSGHEETYFLSALSDTVGPQGKPNKTNVQGVGSSVSYLRRYLTYMIFNVALRDDNDGNRIKPNAPMETGELITRPQIAELRALMLETRIMESVVLAKKAPGLATIEALPSAAFHVIRNDLLSRKNVLAQRAANSQSSNGAAA